MTIVDSLRDWWIRDPHERWLLTAYSCSAPYQKGDVLIAGRDAFIVTRVRHRPPVTAADASAWDVWARPTR